MLLPSRLQEPACLCQIRWTLTSQRASHYLCIVSSICMGTCMAFIQRYGGAVDVLHHLPGHVVFHPSGSVEHRWVHGAELPLGAARSAYERAIPRAVSRPADPGDRARPTSRPIACPNALSGGGSAASRAQSPAGLSRPRSDAGEFCGL